MLVLFIRSQHAIGEVTTVGRIREGLRLERQARVRPVMLAVQSGRGTIEGRRGVELDARLGREQAHRQAVLRRTQRGDLRKTAFRIGQKRGHEVRVVGGQRRIADRAGSAKVVWRAGDGADLAGRNELVVGRRVEVSEQPQLMVENVGRAVEVEIAVLGEIDDGRPVGDRRELDPERRGFKKPIDAGRGEVSGESGVAVRRFERQLDRRSSS